MNLKEAGKLANSSHVDQAIRMFRTNGLDWLLEVTGRELPRFRYTVVAGDRVPTKAFGFLVAQIAGGTSRSLNDMTVNDAAAILKRAAGAISVRPGSRSESVSERNARMESYYRQLARPEQAAFRELVRSAFGSKCAITGCGATSTLEAAHVDPWSNSRCDDLSNGVLLRADLHRMFDANHLAVDPATGRVCVHIGCRDHYAGWESWTIYLPPGGPNLGGFKSRWEAFDGN